MNKLNIIFLIAICLSISYARDCVNQYYGIDETTGQIMVEGLFNTYGKDDNDYGEYYSDGDFQSFVTEKADGVYNVKGEFSINVQAIVKNPHLCTQIFEKSWQYFKIPYQFTKQRDLSRAGQQYTEDEVIPISKLIAIRTEMLKSFTQFAIQKDESQYIIDTLQKLVEKSEQRFK